MKTESGPNQRTTQTDQINVENAIQGDEKQLLS